MNTQWLKSSYSEQPHGNCLEIALLRDRILIRESEAPDDVLGTTASGLRTLLEWIRDGRDIS